MKKIRNNTTKPLAELVYNKAIREEIEERVKVRYLKRINYLVGANNELMNELEQQKTMTKKQQRKDMLKKYEGKLSGPYDHLKEGVDYLDDIQKNKKMTTKTSFGEYFDIQRDKIVKDMQDKNKQQNVEWMERYEMRKKMAKEMMAGNAQI